MLELFFYVEDETLKTDVKIENKTHRFWKQTIMIITGKKDQCKTVTNL